MMINKKALISFFSVLVLATTANAAAPIPQGSAVVVGAPQPRAFVKQSKASPSSLSTASVLDVAKGGAAKKAVAPLNSKSASVALGLILSFNSGFINGCCLSGAAAATGAKQAVAAVTASWTNSAVGLASGNMGQFKFLGTILLCYFTGSAIAGVLKPTPAATFSFEQIAGSRNAFFAAAAVICAAARMLGVAEDDSVKMGFYLATMANGIQNSITSTLTANLCRSAHFSGITSDMGTFFGQVIRGNKTNLYKLKVFAGLALCFWLGGYSSFSISKEYAGSCLYASGALYVLLGLFFNPIAKQMIA